MKKRGSHKDIVLSGGYDGMFASNNYPMPFEFNKDVAKIFDNMASRSIPLYKEVNYSVVEWAKSFYQKPAKIYDIGCSTGTTILSIAQNLDEPVHFIGIDNSKPMIEQSKNKLKFIPAHHSLDLYSTDAMDVDYTDATMVVVNYTLQFIEVSRRKLLLNKIYSGMKKGGILFVSEKIKSQVPEFQKMITMYYENFKFRNGYSMNEIERKKEALDNVLVPQTTEEQIEMVLEAGFSACELLFKCNNFITYVAIKK